LKQDVSNGPNANRHFVDYYAEQSASEQTRQRFARVQEIILKQRSELGLTTTALDVTDVGCGAGTQTMAWARNGHRARGVDISAPLIEIARKRAAEASLPAEFHVGSASKLPFENGSSDVVLASELLEHLTDWEASLNEALRVLRPGGVIYFSTTNRLCPIQQEFTLPLYSWYPASAKKYCERLAVTTHRHWVQYATFPAVHWFTFYQFRDYLDARGVSTRDRFDIMETKGSMLRSAVVAAVRRSKSLRFLGHVLTPYTVVVGYKRPATS
jgi:2-polyprenyl-6-hydroxyphenyl methylase/3-demethylubiquinone-9 3-methyltransferase